MELSCPLRTTRRVPQEKCPQNKSFIDQVCSVKMTGYWPRSFIASCVSVNKHAKKKNLANIQPSWPHTWSITSSYYNTGPTRASNARDEWSLPAFFATTVPPCSWTAKVERGWKKTEEKVNLFLFTMYLVPFFVVLSCFVRIEDFLLISLPVVYSGPEKFAWIGAGELCWRAIELGYLQVSFVDKQNVFDLFTMLTVVICIDMHSPFDRVPDFF